MLDPNQEFQLRLTLAEIVKLIELAKQSDDAPHLRDKLANVIISAMMPA